MSNVKYVVQFRTRRFTQASKTLETFNTTACDYGHFKRKLPLLGVIETPYYMIFVSNYPILIEYYIILK
jgi:hypothetical protein